MPVQRGWIRSAAAFSVAVLALAFVPNAQAQTDTPQVAARVETPPGFDDAADRNADMDDPAIYVPSKRHDKPLVVTTGKEAGLRVYDLRGRLIQDIPAVPSTDPDLAPARYNNVDIAYGVQIGDDELDLAVVSDRGRDRVRIFRIDADKRKPLKDITVANAPRVFSATEVDVEDQESAYGLTSYTDSEGTAFVATSRRHRGDLALLSLADAGQGRVTYSVVRRLVLPSTFTLPDGYRWTPCNDPGEDAQVEGMVFDPANDRLYAAQEQVGIWSIPIDLSSQGHLIDKVKEFGIEGTYDVESDECNAGTDHHAGGAHLTADAEGLTIYSLSGRSGYLIASSQGDSTFAVYDRVSHAHLGQFAVGDSTKTDGVQESDGSTAVSARLPGYPHGLFISHDGHATPSVLDSEGNERTGTNFKYVDWRRIATALDLKLAKKQRDHR